MKLMTDEIAAKLIAALGLDRPATETPVVVKYFTPDANATWFITEGELLEGGDYRLFGFCDLGDPQMAELGYVLLSQLKEVRGKMNLPVERDLYFPDTMLSEVLKRYGKFYREHLKD